MKKEEEERKKRGERRRRGRREGGKEGEEEEKERETGRVETRKEKTLFTGELTHLIRLIGMDRLRRDFDNILYIVCSILKFFVIKILKNLSCDKNTLYI